MIRPGWVTKGVVTISWAHFVGCQMGQDPMASLEHDTPLLLLPCGLSMSCTPYFGYSGTQVLHYCTQHRVQFRFNTGGTTRASVIRSIGTGFGSKLSRHSPAARLEVFAHRRMSCAKVNNFLPKTHRVERSRNSAIR